VPSASSSPRFLRSPLRPPYSLDRMAAPNRATRRSAVCARMRVRVDLARTPPRLRVPPLRLPHQA
jgi:hypothetical protein